ncbi:metallophosphoesterase family protein [Nesterenkonia xinjiangensis]|uniref:Putative phosphodiesterase n=2 Tax=Nesterenkonia xinjiangensis TaxID=225327 RepID=A0A7Z0K942_9MICC|nr:metallophosphoesterase family protein [Nesterenkonia xinjiangensis]NYJ78291.1 putative phosphodiesterase [Nesterenkonia xinjiangensis]
MRIAVISDVHGNLLALDAVLADAAEQSVDQHVNLGDLLSGGVAPRLTADRLMDAGMKTIAGNHERQLLTLRPEEMGASDRFAMLDVTARQRDWLASLPSTLVVTDGVLACHGSPDDDLTYLLETVERTGVRPATDDEVRARLGAHTEWSLVLCGHTHIPRSLRLAQGPLIVNPGSVGWPAYAGDEPHPHVMEAGTPHARYAVLDDASGRWEVEFRLVAYDWESAALIAESHDRQDVARALRTGRV